MDGFGSPAPDDATRAWTSYISDHNLVRRLDAGGQLQQAISTDQSSAEPSASEVDSYLSEGVSIAVTSFSQGATRLRLQAPQAVGRSDQGCMSACIQSTPWKRSLGCDTFTWMDAAP